MGGGGGARGEGGGEWQLRRWSPAAAVRLESPRGVRESGRPQRWHRQLLPQRRRFRGGAEGPTSVLPPASASAGWACSPAAPRRRRPEELRYGGRRSRGGRAPPYGRGLEAPLRPRTGAGRRARLPPGRGPGRGVRGPGGAVTGRARRCPERGESRGRPPRGGGGGGAHS